MQKTHRGSFHDHLVRAMGENILSGRWPEGQPIPSPDHLQTTLRASRTALRESLVALTAKGLIESRQKIGTVVRPKDEWNMLDTDLLLWRVEATDGEQAVAEIYGMRRLIEPLAASLAATHATRRQIGRIRQAFDNMAEAGDDGPKVLEPDVRFHRAIIAASGNALFASIGLIIASALDANFQFIKDSPRGHAWALPLHEAIVKAIEAHDANAARLAMHKLLDASEADLRATRARSIKRRAL